MVNFWVDKMPRKQQDNIHSFLSVNKIINIII